MASKSFIDELIALGGTPPANAESVPDGVIIGMIEQILAQDAKPVMPTYVQDSFVDDETKELMEQYLGNQASAEHLASQQEQVPNMELAPKPINPSVLSDLELEEFLAQEPNNAEALREKDLRERSDNRSLADFDIEAELYQLNRYGRQAGAGFMQALDLPAGAAGIYGIITSPVKPLTGLDVGSDAAIGFAGDRAQAVEDALGVGEPRHVGESLAQIGGMLVPVPGSRGPTTALGNIAEIMTPFVFGASAPRIAANAAIGFGAEQGIRELADDTSSEYQTIFDIAGMGDVSPEENEGINPFALGALAGATTLSIATPMAMSIWKGAKTQVPEIKNVSDIDILGPENLQSMETAGDLYKFYGVDEKQVGIDLAQRAGMPIDVFNDVERLIDINTQMAGTVRVNEGLLTGTMRSKFGDFTSPVSPKLLFDTYKQFDPQMQADVDLYLKLGDLADDLRLQLQTGVGPGSAQADLNRVQRQRAQLRLKSPQIGAFSNDYQRITEAVREYLGKGPYAMLDSKGLQGLNRERRHYVPVDMRTVDPDDSLLSRIADTGRSVADKRMDDWFLIKRDIANVRSVNKRENSVDVLVDYVYNALASKLHNDVRGAYIDGMLGSKYGNKTIRKAKDTEIDKHASRIVPVYRAGKKEQMISSRLQAEFLRMDPYIINNPILAGIYGLRRGFEHGTTGALSITFAPTTAIRDTLAGWALAEPNMKGPSIRGTLAAPPTILKAKLQRAIFNSIDARLKANNPFPFIPQQAQAQLSARLSNSYFNSIYHLANESGGFDASLMKSRIEAGKGIINEVSRSMPNAVNKTYGVTLGPLLQGWKAIFDSIQEAPRFNTFVRNVDAGMDAEEAVTRARKITGDTTRSGRVYGPDGHRVLADAVNKDWTAFSNVMGGAIEGVRLSIPYVNPAVQGMRKMFSAASNDPMRFAMRNWLSIGLPSVTAYAWNNLLSSEGEYDYNKYAFEQRSERDQVMEMYIGIPGLPPEQGLSIPIAHEQTMHMAPYQTLLYHMGGSNDEILSHLTQTGISILENTLGMGPPVPISLAFNAAGYKAPESITAPWKDTYELRESDVGFLPSNVEQAARTAFGAISQTALDTAYAFAEEGDIRAAGDEFINSVVSRTPVLKGVMGHKTPVTYFTPLQSEQERKLDAYYEFTDLYDEHFRSPGMHRRSDWPSGANLSDPTTADGINMDLPIGYVAPGMTPKPVNPLYELFGEQIRDTFETNGVGMLNVKARQSVLTKQVRLLRGYNAGRARAFKEYQEMLNTTPVLLEVAEEEANLAQEAYDNIPRGEKTTTPEGLAAKEAKERAEFHLFTVQEQQKVLDLIEENDIDLSNRFDVNRLVSLLEQERFATMKQQLAIIEKLEDQITDQMIAQGLLSPGQKFQIEKHLDPMLDPRQ